MVRKKNKKPGNLGFGTILPDEIMLSRICLQDCLTRYVFASRFVKDRVTLDIACGGGYGSRYLLYKGAKGVVGGDISAGVIEYAKNHYATDGIEFAVMDATRLPFQDETFDAVVSMETIEHLIMYEWFLHEVRRVLKDNGIFICSTPNKDVESPGAEKTSTPVHVKEFYLEEFRSLLSNQFALIDLYGFDFLTNYERLRTKFLGRIATFIKRKLYWVPQIEISIGFITRFIFKEYHPTKLESLNDWDKLIDDRLQPTLLGNNSLSPKYLIALARVCKLDSNITTSSEL